MTKTNNDKAQKEKIAQFMWLCLILMFFLIQAVIWTVAISVTATDQSHAVVAGYDEKALLWDEEKARRLASTQLGWHSAIEVDSTSDIRGFKMITVKLEDADHMPIEDAEVNLKTFHRARAAQPQLVQLIELGDGRYTGQAQIRKSGWWQFEGTVRKDGDTLLINERESIKAKN